MATSHAVEIGIVLQQGEAITVDSGHVVAFDAGMQSRPPKMGGAGGQDGESIPMAAGERRLTFAARSCDRPAS